MRVSKTFDAPADGDPCGAATHRPMLDKLAANARVGILTYATHFDLKVVEAGAWFIGAAAGTADGRPAWVTCGAGLAGDTPVYFSRDGQSWAEQANPRFAELDSVAYSAALGLWALVGISIAGDAYLLTSPNGRAPFTERTNPAAVNLNGVCAGASGHFVAVGDLTAGQPYILRSTDGITWAQQSSLLTQALYDVTYANAVYVAVGGQNGDPRAMSSADGVTWLEHAVVGSNIGFLRSVSWNGAYFFALSSQGEIYRSSNGLSWAQVRAATEYSAWSRAIEADPETGIILATGDQATGIVASYDNGDTWSSVFWPGSNDGVTNNMPMSLAFGHGRFLLGAQSGVVGVSLSR